MDSVKKIILISILFPILSGCTSFGTTSIAPEIKPNPFPEPSPSPTPEKKPEEVYRCKISNGAGRIFTAIDESRDRSEAKARHQCEIFSRTCILLDCLKTESDGE